MNSRILVTLLVIALVLPGVARATPPAYFGGQFRYWAFSGGNDLRDVLAYWVPGPFHVQLEYWDFVRGEDQFRPELGLHLRDRRRSVYTVQWRHERNDERFTFGTDQVLSDHVVGRVEVSPIVGSDSTLWVLSGGGDYYWGSYNFVTATLIHDPRGDGLWVVPLRIRLANEEDDWLQVTVAPASRRTFGWAVDVKKRWLRLGIERNNRYDFTDLNSTTYTVGFQRALGPRP